MEGWIDSCLDLLCRLFVLCSAGRFTSHLRHLGGGILASWESEGGKGRGMGMVVIGERFLGRKKGQGKEEIWAATRYREGRIMFL